MPATDARVFDINGYYPSGASGPYSLAAFRKVIDYALKHVAKP